MSFQDGSLSKEEFAFCWNNWVKKVVRPVSALLIVDVQNDFISGSLAISNCPAQHNGEEVKISHRETQYLLQNANPVIKNVKCCQTLGKQNLAICAQFL